MSQCKSLEYHTVEEQEAWTVQEAVGEAEEVVEAVEAVVEAVEEAVEEQA